MTNKFNQLSFIIGAFFILVAAVLVVGFFLSPAMAEKINLYTGVGLLAFGVFMTSIKASE